MLLISKADTMKGKLITFEGIDGCGKSTQVALLEEYLSGRGLDVLVLREPGGTEISERIRGILLDRNSGEMTALTELFLYLAARAQIVTEVMKVAVDEGKWVICDRFTDSSVAYQGYGRGISHSYIDSLNRSAAGTMIPDLTVILNISPEQVIARLGTKIESDRLESEDSSFKQRVYEGFLQIGELYPERCVVLDGTPGIDEIKKNVIEVVELRLFT